MKQVIFVGGTSRSGSTLLNLMLGNHPDGLGLGEIHATLRPIWKHHIRVRKGLEQSQDIWNEIIHAGDAGLYPAIFKHFPQYRYLVDSSKQIFWIRSQSAHCARNGESARHVLIYKSPAEIANSFLKRGLPWQAAYVGYHRKYTSLIDEAYVLSYKDLVTNPGTLEDLCSYLGIAYRDDMMRYWEGKGNVFFGSPTPKNVTSIRYDAPDQPGLDEHVSESLRANPRIQRIWEVLESHRNQVVDFRTEAFDPFRLPPGTLRLMALKYRAHVLFRRLFPKTPGPGI